VPQVEDVDLGPCPGRLWAGDPGRAVVALPGAHPLSITTYVWPLLALVGRGWSAVEIVEFVFDRRPDDPDAWARERAELALGRVAQAETVLVLAKSLSTRAASVAAERGLPAVWLTPLLPVPEIAAALRARTAPALLVGGTNDESWDGEFARELSDDVLELEGADHGLAPANGDPRGTLANHARVVDRVLEFVERIA
jgi:hypothetical protein